jgi:RHS repeat-associated protein
LGEGSGAASNTLKFAGKERDVETGFGSSTWLPLDYFGARYYQQQLGRFLSVDPVFTWEENLIDPQRWNRYSYVRNNPLRYVDPDGRMLWGLLEFGFTVNDARDAYSTWTNPNASRWDKGAAVVGAVIGAVAPGSSYGQALKRVDDVVESTTTALSTYRRTTAGETFYHYGYASQAARFLGGLVPNGWATSLPGLSGARAKSGLALPFDAPRDAVYTVTPARGTWVRANPVAEAKYGQPGGLPEYQFPNGTGPGTVAAPRRTK